MAERQPSGGVSFAPHGMLNLTWSGPQDMPVTSINRDQLRMIKAGDSNTFVGGLGMLFAGAMISELVGLLTGSFDTTVKSNHVTAFLVFLVATAICAVLAYRDKNHLKADTLAEIAAAMGLDANCRKIVTERSE